MWFEKWFQRTPTKTDEGELSFKDIFREVCKFPSQFYSAVIIGDDKAGKTRYVLLSPVLLFPHALLIELSSLIQRRFGFRFCLEAAFKMHTPPPYYPTVFDTYVIVFFSFFQTLFFLTSQNRFAAVATEGNKKYGLFL